MPLQKTTTGVFRYSSLLPVESGFSLPSPGSSRRSDEPDKRFVYVRGTSVLALTKSGSARNEYNHSRALAVVSCSSPNMASQTVAYLPHRLFPSRLLPEHDCDRDWHAPEQYRGL